MGSANTPASTPENENPETTTSPKPDPAEIPIGDLNPDKPPVETKDPPKEEKDPSEVEAWRRLAEKDAELATKEREFQKEKQALAEQQQKMGDLDIDQVSAALQSKDPKAALEALGFDPETAHKALGDRLNDPLKVLEDQLKTISAKQDQLEEENASLKSEKEQQAIADKTKEHLDYIDGLVDQNVKDYPLIKASQASDTVLQMMLLTANKGQELTFKGALDIVEATLRESYDEVFKTDYARQRIAELSKSEADNETRKDDPSQKPPSETQVSPPGPGGGDPNPREPEDGDLPQDPKLRWEALKKRHGVQNRGR